MRDIVPGIGCFKTPEELFASERLNVVHIITPPATHASLANMALKAGCHIYVEKPFTESVEDAQQILDDASAKGLKVCAGHQLLYEPPTRVLTKYVSAIGKVVHVESYFSFRSVRSPADNFQRGGLPALRLRCRSLPHVARGHALFPPD